MAFTELFTKGKHGVKSDLTPEEVAGLVEYLNHFGE